LDKIVQTWEKAQTEDGRVGTGKRWGVWDVSAHKYILLGLVDYYALTGDQDALNAARKIGDLMCATFGPDKGNIMQVGAWALGSANILEPMTYLYRYTSDPKYLRFCQYLVASFEGPTGPKLISILTTGSRRVCDVEDPWASRPAREVYWKRSEIGQIRNRSKGYETLSCFIGLARMYQLTGEPEYLAVAVNAWKDISEHRLYLTGSSGADECFKDDHCLPGETSDQPAEACVTAHWMFLNRILFEITGDPQYIDALEIALFNHMLASQRPQDCYQSYNTAINGTKTFGLQRIWTAPGQAPCCLASTMREIARTPEVIWTKFAADGLGVLIYNAGVMEDTIQTKSGPLPVRVEMESAYPKSGEVTIRVRPQRPASFRVALRVPAWAKGFTARVGNHSYNGKPGTFLNLEREWRAGDTVTIAMDLNDRLVPGGASYPGYFAFMHGPQVLTLVANNGAEGNLDRATVRANVGTRLSPARDCLPDGWVGDQAYTTPALVGAAGCALVPFGDAGQPGKAGQYRTWVPAQAGTAPPTPAAPSGLTATTASPYQINLIWIDNSRDEDGFRLERMRSDVGVWFHVKTTRPGVTRCVDDAVNVVLPGKTYIYRVAAYNAGGLSAYSSEATVTTPAIAVPAAPSDLKVVAVSPTQIKLMWTDNSDTEEGFRVECRIGAEGQWIQIAGRVRANLPTFTDFGLDSGQTCTYRARAFNAAGESAWSNEVIATTADGRLP
jgi:DUF1680 family protein